MDSPLSGNEVSSYDNLKFIQSLKELTASIDEGIIITDEKENILWVNNAFEKICGIALSDLIGKKPNTFQGIDTNEETVTVMRNAVKNEQPIDTEILNYQPDKTPYWIKLNISPIKDSKGTLTNYVAFEHDITHEKNIEIDLQKTELQYKDLFEKNPCVMWICDTVNFKFIEVNQAAIDKYGYSWEEFMKMSLKDVKTAEDIANLDDAFSDESETYRDRGIVEHYRKNGESIFVDVKTNRVNYAGKPCSLALLNDVTDRVRKEKEIKELNKKLEQRIIESDKNNAELAKANQRYEFVSKAANEAIWDLDLETNIISFGGSYKEMFGYSYPNDKIELRKIQHILHPDDIGRVNKSIADALSNPSQRFWEGYYKVIKKGGGIVYVHDRAYIIYNEHTGKPVRFVGAIQNITQEKKSEEALLEQMKKVNIIIQSITDIFYVVDTNFDLLYSNTAMEILTGKTKEELRGKNIWDIFNDVDISLPKSEFEKALLEKKESEFEMEYREKTYLVALHYSEIGLTVSGKDVTTLKRREEEIKSYAKFLKEISNSTAGFIFQLEYDSELRPKLNYASEKAYEYWGVEISEIMNDYTKVLSAIHPEDIEKVKDALKEMLNNHTQLNVKYRYVNKITDEVKWVRASGIASGQKNGKTIVNGIVTDITEIEYNYKQLEEANRRFEYLSKATHETIWERDLETDVFNLGGGYREMFGMEFPDNKISFSEWKKLIHPDDLKRTIKCMDDTLGNPSKSFWECNYCLKRGDGLTLDVFEKAYIIYDKIKDKPVKIIGSTRDVTALKKIQREKDNLIKDLIKRNQVLEQFTFMVSHNLRAPLANLMGIHEILEDESTTDKERETMYALNKKSVYRLNDVITDMNEILSVKKNMDEDRTTIVFADILKRVDDEVHSALSKTKLVIQSDFSKAESIFSIPSYIRSIFQNLITNSIKYRHDGSSYIKITSDEDNDYIYLTFEDDGMGIDLTKNHSKVFGLYNRFHLGIEGKGMGLFMVKSQIESLHGEISVESKVNVGTKFFIKFKK